MLKGLPHCVSVDEDICDYDSGCIGPDIGSEPKDGYEEDNQDFTEHPIDFQSSDGAYMISYSWLDT